MKLRVVVVFGGESVEHEISILSAHQVMEEMNPYLYEVIPLYLSKDGKMYHDITLCSLETFEEMEKIPGYCSEVTLIHRNQHFFIIPVKHSLFAKEKEFDIVFPILHGTHGEDGSFQGFLSTLKIPYVGPRVLGGAIGQDKIIMKQVLEDSALPIVPWYYWTLSKPLDDSFFRKAERLGYPLVVKPANLGSSIGISITHNEVELHKAMIEAYQYDRRVIIEKVVENLREINCSVLGDEVECIASVLEEVKKQDDILSYKDKYIGVDASKGMQNAPRKIPADLEEDLTLEIQELAKETFKTLCGSGVSRIDFLMNDESKDLYINEINTIPGSLSFYLWQKSGIPFPELITRLLDMAIKQYARDQKQIYSYPTNILTMKHQGMKAK
ncbi:MAG: D-alanine--D-alanine ligase family protein [Longicatena sp.]